MQLNLLKRNKNFHTTVFAPLCIRKQFVRYVRIFEVISAFYKKTGNRTLYTGYPKKSLKEAYLESLKKENSNKEEQKNNEIEQIEQKNTEIEQNKKFSDSDLEAIKAIAWLEKVHPAIMANNKDLKTIKPGEYRVLGNKTHAKETENIPNMPLNEPNSYFKSIDHIDLDGKNWDIYNNVNEPDSQKILANSPKEDLVTKSSNLLDNTKQNDLVAKSPNILDNKPIQHNDNEPTKTV